MFMTCHKSFLLYMDFEIFYQKMMHQNFCKALTIVTPFGDKDGFRLRTSGKKLGAHFLQ